jgi:hypothetical protein
MQKTKNIRIYPYSKNGVSKYHLSYYPNGTTRSAPGVRTKSYYNDEFDIAISQMYHLQKLVDEGSSFEEICKAAGFTM